MNGSSLARVVPSKADLGPQGMQFRPSAHVPVSRGPASHRAPREGQAQSAGKAIKRYAVGFGSLKQLAKNEPRYEEWRRNKRAHRK